MTGIQDVIFNTVNFYDEEVLELEELEQMLIRAKQDVLLRKDNESEADTEEGKLNKFYNQNEELESLEINNNSFVENEQNKDNIYEMNLDKNRDMPSYVTLSSPRSQGIPSQKGKNGAPLTSVTIDLINNKIANPLSTIVHPLKNKVEKHNPENLPYSKFKKV